MPHSPVYRDSEEAPSLLQLSDYIPTAEDVMLDVADEKTLLSVTWKDPKSIRRRLSPSNVTRNAKWGLYSALLFLLPSFKNEKQQLGPTAWIDGVRGVAALMVYFCHWDNVWFGQDYLQIPLLRTLKSGSASVCIFFVISGFVLTIKPLSQIHKGGPHASERVLGTLCGALFRRPFRLFLPCIASTFIIAVVAVASQSAGHRGVFADMRFCPDLPSQLADWAWETLALVNPFAVHTSHAELPFPAYNAHLWTIPVEFRASVLLFLLLLAFAKVARWLALASVVTVAWALISTRADSELALFCAGLVLAETTLIFPPRSAARQSNDINNDDVNNNTSVAATAAYWLQHVVTIAAAILGLHLMGYPDTDSDRAHAVGFHTVSALTPTGMAHVPARWSLSVGAVLFITACMYSAPLRLSSGYHRYLSLPMATAAAESDAGTDHTGGTASAPLLQRPFNTHVAQYLGRVSYSLYLVHALVYTTIGWPYADAAQAAHGAAVATAEQLVSDDEAKAAALRDAWVVYKVAWAWTTLWQTLLLLWVSDVFTRGVDANCIRFTRWLWRAVKTE